MKKTILIIVLAALCLFFKAMAKEKPNNISALKIGDKVPDITINNIINYKDANGKSAATAKISDFKGKLLILDFWATWCSSCIENFPKMEFLQREFGNKIQVLAVTYEDRKKIIEFFASKAGRKYYITSVVNDTLLSMLFPHQGIPHCVWIDNDFRVKAITGAEEVNARNIRKVLTNTELDVEEKKDQNTKKPLFLSADFPASDSLLHYSILSKGSYSGLPSGNHLRKSGNIVRGQAVTNSTILWIYKTAIINLFTELGESYDDKRLVMHVKEPAKITLNLSKSNDGTYDRGNLYNYDILVPLKEAAKLYSFMLDDLNKYTEYNGRIEKITSPCLVLKRLDSIDRIKTKGGTSANTLFYTNPFSITNYPVKNLIDRLNDQGFIKLPIIDDTGYKENIDIHLQNTQDLNTLKEELKSYGLALIQLERPINMFILSDKAIDDSGTN